MSSIMIPTWLFVLLLIPYGLLLISIILYIIIRLCENAYDRRIRNKYYGKKHK